MTLAFGMLTLGAILLYTAFTNNTVEGLVKGEPGPGQPADRFADTTSDATTTSGGGGGGKVNAGDMPSGVVQFEGTPVCAWIAAELKKARANGWKGSVTSGYRSAARQAEICATTSNPCAAPGQSNHQDTKYPGCAVDVSDAQGLQRALPKGSPLKYTGASIGDYVHFSSGKEGV